MYVNKWVFNLITRTMSKYSKLSLCLCPHFWYQPETFWIISRHNLWYIQLNGQKYSNIPLQLQQCRILKKHIAQYSIIIITILIYINKRHVTKRIAWGTSRSRDKKQLWTKVRYCVSSFSCRVRACEKLCLLSPLEYWQMMKTRPTVANCSR